AVSIDFTISLISFEVGPRSINFSFKIFFVNAMLNLSKSSSPLSLSLDVFSQSFLAFSRALNFSITFKVLSSSFLLFFLVFSSSHSNSVSFFSSSSISSSSSFSLLFFSSSYLLPSFFSVLSL
ncbi:hypothetical protein KFU42_28860, partial [Escherichia coli]|nr:hypothetical protein [Escherichia coli]